MIACYVWTDIQLINVIHLYKSRFVDQQADLFVYMLGRMNETLLQQVEKEKIFRRIIRVPQIQLEAERSMLWKIPYLKGLIASLYRKKVYSAFYKKNIGKKKYDLLLTPGYWAETVYLANYLLKHNPKLEAAFVEEGTRHYTMDKDVLCRCQIDGGVRQKIMKALISGRNYRKIDGLPKRLFLYEPAARQTAFALSVEKLPFLSQADAVVHRCIRALRQADDLQEYAENKIFFFQPSDIPIYADGDGTTGAILQTVRDTLPEMGMLLKMHPTNTLTEKECQQRFQTDAVVDCRIRPFEMIADKISMDDKIFISRNSSCFLTTKYMFDMEPVLIFIYQIYAGRTPAEDREIRIAIEGLRKLYRDKWKIIEVSSREELKEKLQGLKDRLEDDLQEAEKY